MAEVIITNKDELRSSIMELFNHQFKNISNYIESNRMNDERPLTPKEAIKYLSMSKSTFYRYVKAGLIHKYSLGEKIYYKKSQLDKAIIKIN